jgi:integrase-like protein
MDKANKSVVQGLNFTWDEYIKTLINKGVKPTVARWYVIRAEHFLKAFPEKNLKQITVQNVNDYFLEIGRSKHLSDWQFRQIIDSVRMLFPYSTTNMENEVDWDYWLSSSKSLNENHPSIAREQPIEIADSNDLNEGSISIESGNSHDKVFSSLKKEIRRRNYAASTEKTYVLWLSKFIQFHKNRSPLEMFETEVIRFLEYLAIKRNVTASTQNLALNALVFFYKHVLNRPLGEMHDIVRAKKPKKLPVVLTRDEIHELLKHLQGVKSPLDNF